MLSGSRSSSLVWLLVEATAYRAYKICHVVGLKKSQCYSLRFIRKAPTKNKRIVLTETNHKRLSYSRSSGTIFMFKFPINRVIPFVYKS